MSAPASGRFAVAVGRMTTYTAEIRAESKEGARAIAEFLMNNADVFDTVFAESDEQFDILDISQEPEASR